MTPVTRPQTRARKTKAMASGGSSRSSSPDSEVVAEAKRPIKRVVPLDGKTVQTDATKKKAKVAKLKEEEMLDLSMKSMNITASKIPDPKANESFVDEYSEREFIMRAIAQRMDPDSAQEGAALRVIKRLSVQERVVYVSNFLFSLPIAWALASPVSGQNSLHALEVKAHTCGYASTKDYVREMLELITAERAAITTETPFSLERLTAFKGIRIILKLIQEYFHR